ncbi:MAG: DUF1573 domain-containing protein [Planctomycetales bacterium]|nr:DUF1573 domain-containing protein [Planctomycetales bacterium]
MNRTLLLLFSLFAACLLIAAGLIFSTNSQRRPGKGPVRDAVISEVDVSDDALALSTSRNRTGQLITEPPAPSLGTPRLECDVTEFDFGAMDPDSKSSHAFRIRNMGDAPLTLSDAGTSCKCTVSSFPREPIAPGGYAEVVLEWKSTEDEREFAQSANFKTNDPSRPNLELTIQGQVRWRIACVPYDLNFTDVVPGQDTKRELLIVSRAWDDLHLETIASSIDGLTWELRDADPELLRHWAARSGYVMTALLPHGMAQGRFTGWLRLHGGSKSDQSQSVDHTVYVGGNVLRRLSIHGRGIDEKGRVTLGHIGRGKGAQLKFLMKVRDDQPELAITKIEATPPFVRVELSPHELANTKPGFYSLT